MPRTNIVIDEELMAAAQKASGLKSKRATVEKGLELLVRQERQKEILRYRGKLHWEGDLEAMRLD
jgi:Arc/MetJ family transcription regulator